MWGGVVGWEWTTGTEGGEGKLKRESREEDGEGGPSLPGGDGRIQIRKAWERGTTFVPLPTAQRYQGELCTGVCQRGNKAA